MHRLAPYLHLARVTTAFACVSNTWLVIIWTRALPEYEPGTQALRDSPLWLLLLGGAGNALGLYAFGVCLNDLLDTRQDRAFRRERPIASGQVSHAGALATLCATLLLAILGSIAFGTLGVLLTVLLAGVIFAFNAFAKFVPGLGFVNLGAIAAGIMLIPNPHIVFLWPVWLVFTHTTLAAMLRHTLGRRVPPISRRAVVAVVLGWIAASSALVVLASSRMIDDEGTRRVLPQGMTLWVFVLPALAGVLFAWHIQRRLARLGPGPRAAEKIARYGALWTALYALAWLYGAGLWDEALPIAILTIVGVLGMTILREWYSLIENPIGYRRHE